MELQRIFKDAAHQEAFEKWHAYTSARGIWLGPDALLHIANAQARPMTGAPGSGRGYSYVEYFTRAAWDKTMPPIEQVQIIDPVPSIDMIPDISIIPDLQLIYGFDFPVYR